MSHRAQRLTHTLGSLAVVHLLLAGTLGLLTPGLAHAQPTTTRVSVGPGGVQGNGSSYGTKISADGRWVAFESRATNLVVGDTNGLQDIFVRDQQRGTTTRVSVGAGGLQANGPSGYPAFSGDGRWVAFHSVASNLVAGDTNGLADVFVHDQQTGTTTRASVAAGDVQGTARASKPRSAPMAAGWRSVRGPAILWRMTRMAGTTRLSSTGRRESRPG